MDFHKVKPTISDTEDYDRDYAEQYLSDEMLKMKQ